MNVKFLLFTFGMFCAISSSAQIGYQVSLLDTKTGEPRVNEQVNVSVSITDSKGKVICDNSQTVTSDAFGVLSMTVGNANTFDNVDWNNLPLNISASVDGVLLGSSQILNIPVAEYAKRTGTLTTEIIDGQKVDLYDGESMTFHKGGTAVYSGIDDEGKIVRTDYSYEIDGNNVYVYRSSHSCWCFHYRASTGRLYVFDD